MTVALDGEWTRTAVDGGPEFPAAKTGKLPMPWGKTPAFPESAFSGTMRYETTVELAAVEGGFAELDLGKARESARVFVNGVEAGYAMMAPWRVRFPASLLKTGANAIAVETVSTGANHLKWLDAEKPYVWKKFTDINIVDINYAKGGLDASKWPQHEAGLYGPVTLKLYK